MIDVLGMVQKAAEKCGFVREQHDDKRLPTDPSNICVMPYFGDLRTLFVMSSILLKRFREEEKPSKYFILCSWPGFKSLFPYVDEYWGIADEGSLKKLYEGASQFRNKSQLVHAYHRNLNHFFFEDVVIPQEVFGTYYGNGITNDFWRKYHHIKRTLPLVPSTAFVGKDFNRDLSCSWRF